MDKEATLTGLLGDEQREEDRGGLIAVACCWLGLGRDGQGRQNLRQVSAHRQTDGRATLRTKWSQCDFVWAIGCVGPGPIA